MNLLIDQLEFSQNGMVTSTRPQNKKNECSRLSGGDPIRLYVRHNACLAALFYSFVSRSSDSHSTEPDDA